MVFVRLFVLLVWVWFSFTVGQRPADGLNKAGEAIAASFFFFAPLLYFLPTYEAYLKKHENIVSIALVNLILGWTVVGWLVSIAWAHRRPETTPVVTTAGITTQHDRLDKLERLVALREKGALTIEEFEAQKKALLGP